jgi:hypothetical protein
MRQPLSFANELMAVRDNTMHLCDLGDHLKEMFEKYRLGYPFPPIILDTISKCILKDVHDVCVAIEFPGNSAFLEIIPPRILNMTKKASVIAVHFEDHIEMRGKYIVMNFHVIGTNKDDSNTLLSKIESYLLSVDPMINVVR